MLLLLMLLMRILLLLPLYERVPLLRRPDLIKLEVSPIAFALKELLALHVKLLQVFDCLGLFLIIQPQMLVLLHCIEPSVSLSAAFLDLFDFRRKLLNPLVGLLNLRLLLG